MQKIFLTNSLRMEKYQHLINGSFLLEYLHFILKHSLMEWKNFLLMIARVISAHAALLLGGLFIACASFLMLHLPKCHAKACIKRHVAQKVIQRKAVVKDAQSFHDYTKEFIIPSTPILLTQKR